MGPSFSRRHLLAAGLLAAATPAGAQEGEMEDRLGAILADSVARGRVVGAVFVVRRDGAELHGDLAGSADRERDIAIRRDTIFRLGQMTQPITAVATLAEAEAGRLSLDDEVTRWLPAFRPRLPDGTAPAITVRHLLTHTAGLSYGFLQPAGNAYERAGVSDGFDQPALSLPENLARLASVPLSRAPGGVPAPSLGYDVLGAVLQRAADAPLSEIVARRVTGPLGMADTSFVAAADRLAKPYSSAAGASRAVVPSETWPGVPRLDPRRALARMAYPSGGAGMVGTADEYARLLEALRTGGGSLLRPDSARLIASTLAPRTGHLPPGSLTRGGAWGTRCWVDPGEGLTVVLLTNTSPGGGEGGLSTGIWDAIWPGR